MAFDLGKDHWSNKVNFEISIMVDDSYLAHTTVTLGRLRKFRSRLVCIPLAITKTAACSDGMNSRFVFSRLDALSRTVVYINHIDLHLRAVEV
jgi:hypothetical protein